ncbi:MAG TPA: BTAD domain-containing putative transcriptional regulator [Catenuloplanes sp.]
MDDEARGPHVMPATAGVRFGVLGQVRVDTARGPLPLSGPRERKIVAVLLVGRGAVVTLDHLINAVWDERMPVTARRQVQNCVSALRRQLVAHGGGRGVILADGPGYRIRLSSRELDLDLFDTHVATGRSLALAGDHERAVTQLRAALDLWRGPALAGLDGRIIESTAARLEEQRLAVIEECIDLELSLGRHREVIAELMGLVADQPLRERLVGQLMLALYRSGRQADALRRYVDTRAILHEELGVDPGRRLQELHCSILTADDGLLPGAAEAVTTGGADPVARDTRAVVPAQTPMGVAHFVGRTRQLKELDELLSTDSTVGICVVAGMAGVGKTTLAVHWAHRVSGRFPDGQVYLNLRGHGPNGSTMTAGEALRGLLSALAVPPASMPTSIDAQAGLYRSLIAARRLLIVLDNAGSVEQIGPLLPGAPSSLVLVTSRSRLPDLLAGGAASLVLLDPLPPGEAQRLLAQRLGQERTAAEPSAVREIIGRCAGLPLALALVAARATANPTFPLRAVADGLAEPGRGLDAFTDGGSTVDVRATFSWSYRQLSAAAARLFRWLGLHFGPDLTAPAAASLAGEPLREVRLALAELTAAHLTTENLPGRYGMHDLLRAYAAELVRVEVDEAERLAATQRLLDHYLHSAYRADRTLHEHRHPITPLAPQPAVHPERLDGRDEALAWFTAEHPVLLAAVRGAVAVGLDQHAWQLGWALATFHDFRGACGDWVATQRIALGAAQRLGDPIGQAHAHRGLGRANLRLGRAAEALDHLRSALDHFADLHDAVGQARTHLDLAWSADAEDDHGRALDHHRQALEHFRAAGHLPGQADAMIGIGRNATLLGDHDHGLAVCRQAVELSQRIGQRHSEAGAWDGLGCTYHHLGDHGQAAGCHRRAHTLFRTAGARFCEAWALVHLGDAQQAGGDVAAARSVWRSAADILDDLMHPDSVRVRERLRR